MKPKSLKAYGEVVESAVFEWFKEIWEDVKDAGRSVRPITHGT